VKLFKSYSEGFELIIEFLGHSVADLSVEFFKVSHIFEPEVLVNGKEILYYVNGDAFAFKTGDVDIFGLGKVTDSGLVSSYLACAAVKDPEKNTHIVAKAGPDEVAFIVGSEPVNVEDKGNVRHDVRHAEPMSKVIAHIVAAEGKHSHGVSSYYADSTGSSCGSFGSHSGTNEYAVGPVKGLIYEGSGLSSSATEDDSIDGNACRIVEFRGDAGAVFSKSGETAVGMSATGRLILLVVGSVIPLVALPVDCVCGRIVVKTFPPNGVIVEVMNNVGKDGFLLGGVESIGVRLEVSTGSNAEETVFGVTSPESAVRSGTEPSDIVAYAPYFISLFLKELGRNKHCEVGLTASRGECSANVVNFAVGIFNAEDEHMLSKPAFFSCEVGCYTESEALFAEKNVSAVTGVNGHDGIVFRELNDITIFFVDIFSCVNALDKIVAVSESFNNFFTGSGHNEHVKYDVDGVGDLEADLCEGRADNAHGVGDNIHGSADHGAVVKLVELFIHFLRIAPVVGVTCVFLLGSADEGSAFNTGNVVNSGSVEVASGELLLVELDDLAGGASFFSESFSLFSGTVYPDYFIRFCKSLDLFDPSQYGFIGYSHNTPHISYLQYDVKITNRFGGKASAP